MNVLSISIIKMALKSGRLQASWEREFRYVFRIASQDFSQVFFMKIFFIANK
jgi:hypothetical protein